MLRLPIGDFDALECLADSPSLLRRKLSKSRPVTWASDTGAYTAWFQDGQWIAVLSRCCSERARKAFPTKAAAVAFLKANWEFLTHGHAPTEAN